MGYTQGNTGLSPISGINSQVSWNVNGGFQSHASFEFSASQLQEALFGPSELTPEQQAIAASLANLSPEERARQKIEHGIPLDLAERAAMEAKARAGQMDAFANMGADVWAGLGYMFGGRNRDEGSLMQDLFGMDADVLNETNKNLILEKLEKLKKSPEVLVAEANGKNLGGLKDLDKQKRNEEQIALLEAKLIAIEGGSSQYTDLSGNNVKFTKDTNTGELKLEINDVALDDGDVISRNEKGEMIIVKKEEIGKYLMAHKIQKSIISGNGMKTDGLAAMDFMYDTLSILDNDGVTGVPIFHVYNETGPEYGVISDAANYIKGVLGKNVEPAVDTYTQIINSGALSRGGGVFVHSQGADLLMQGLEKADSKVAANIYLAGGAHLTMPDQRRLSGNARVIGFNNTDPIPNALTDIIGKSGTLAYSSGYLATVNYIAITSVNPLSTNPLGVHVRHRITYDAMKANYFDRGLLSSEEKKHLAPGVYFDAVAAHSYSRSYTPFFKYYRHKTGRSLLNNW